MSGVMGGSLLTGRAMLRRSTRSRQQSVAIKDREPAMARLIFLIIGIILTRTTTSPVYNLDRGVLFIAAETAP